MTLLRDFLAFPPGILLELFARVLFACACGALIGFERARRFKEAGMRTHCIIAAAASLLMVLSKYCFADLSVADGFFSGDRGADPARIAAQIVSGVGFLGAGVIFRSGATVKGLTTAAGLWASACMGLAIGAGFYECVFLGTVLIFLSMRYLPIVENMMVEHAPFLNIYVEFESLDHIGDVIGRIKEQNAQVLDVEVDHGRGPDSSNPSAVFSLRLAKRHSHSDVLVSISELDCVYTVEEF